MEVMGTCQHRLGGGKEKGFRGSYGSRFGVGFGFRRRGVEWSEWVEWSGVEWSGVERKSEFPYNYDGLELRKGKTK